MPDVYQPDTSCRGTQFKINSNIYIKEGSAPASLNTSDLRELWFCESNTSVCLIYVLKFRVPLPLFLLLWSCVYKSLVPLSLSPFSNPEPFWMSLDVLRCVRVMVCHQNKQTSSDREPGVTGCWLNTPQPGWDNAVVGPELCLLKRNRIFCYFNI